MSRLLILAVLSSIVACGDKDEYVPTEDPIDVDGDGYAEDVDCDDLVATVHPDAVEVCDEIDNNCNGEIDEGAGRTYYLDDDADGYGQTDATTTGCAPPTGYAEDEDDCDDTNADVNPGIGADLCDDLDNDCDKEVDEDVTFADYYADGDGDGYGIADDTVNACAPPSGYVDVSGDCDDADPDSYPLAPERCDSADNDCDTVVDNDLVETWYSDGDSDGFGAESGATEDCDPPAGYVVTDTDCDDSDDTSNPLAVELCNGTDNNCDGDIDEDACYTSWTGDRHFQYGVWTVPTQRDCELFWTTTGDRIGYATDECIDCEFAFHVDYTYDAVNSYDNGICAGSGLPVGLDYSRELAYNPSYGAYGPVFYIEYPGYGWVPYYLAGAIKGDILYVEDSGYEDYPYNGNFYTRSTYETATLK